MLCHVSAFSILCIWLCLSRRKLWNCLRSPVTARIFHLVFISLYSHHEPQEVFATIELLTAFRVNMTSKVRVERNTSLSTNQSKWCQQCCAGVAICCNTMCTRCYNTLLSIRLKKGIMYLFQNKTQKIEDFCRVRGRGWGAAVWDDVSKTAAVLLDFVQITPSPIWTTCTTLFEGQKRRFKRHSKWLIIQNSS